MTYCSVVTVLALVGLTKKRFGHCAILNNYPSDHQAVSSDLCCISVSVSVFILICISVVHRLKTGFAPAD